MCCSASRREALRRTGRIAGSKDDIERFAGLEYPRLALGWVHRCSARSLSMFEISLGIGSDGLQ